jgi:DNA (cytosine-5)-methyltransferase 1
MYKILDVFSGAGGLSLGFELTKEFETVSIIEKDDAAIKTFLNNRNNQIMVYRNINDLEFNRSIQGFKDVDVIIGGPPCQGFSNANRQHKRLIDGNNILIKKFVDAIIGLRPLVFLMENVSMINSKVHKFFCTEEDFKDESLLSISIEDTIVIYNNDIFNNDVSQYSEVEYNEKIHDDLVIASKQIRTLIKNINNKSVLKLKTNANKVLEIITQSTSLNLNGLASNKKIRDFTSTLQKDSEDITASLELISEIHKFVIAINLLFELKKYKIKYELDRAGNIVARVRSIQIIDYIVHKLKGYYELDYKILNAIDFGVPQTRKRFYMVGIVKKISTNGYNLNDIKLSESTKTVSDAIKDLSTYTPYLDVESDKGVFIEFGHDENQNLYLNNNLRIFNHITTKSQNTTKKRFEVLKQGENFHNLSSDLVVNYQNPNKTQNSIYLRLKLEQPSNTITNIRKAMWIHPTVNRAVSIREAARLQSFPDYYRFYGNKDQMYQQVGNAVPPLVGYFIAKSLIPTISRLKMLPYK